MNSENDLEAEFAGLRAKFLERCRGHVEVLQRYGGGDTPLSGSGSEELAKLAHSLAGSGGTFGFSEISRRASRLEQLLFDRADAVSVGSALTGLIDEIERQMAA